MARPGSSSAGENPRKTLAIAAWWLRGLGAALAIAGAGVMVHSLLGGADEGRFWRIMRGIGAAAGWLVPGLLYLLFSIYLLRRRRWTITGADVTTYIQMFFAGVLIVVSLLAIKTLWPVMIVALLWAIPLAITPKLMAPCSHAMDLIAQHPTLSVDPVTDLRRPPPRKI